MQEFKNPSDFNDSLKTLNTLKKSLLNQGIKEYRKLVLNESKKPSHPLDFTNRLNASTVKLHLAFMQAANGAETHSDILKTIPNIISLLFASIDGIFNSWEELEEKLK